jgi:hypothetical protein
MSAPLPGEVCTKKAADRLFGADLSADTYSKFLSNATDLNTYDPVCSNNRNRLSTKSMCTVDSQNTAMMHCSLSAGVGFVESGTNCKAIECPPGFRPKGSDTCEVEPLLKDYSRDKRAFCHERWYDWFTVPNYHLGNNYSNTNIEVKDNDVLTSNLVFCYSPCPAGQMPLYRTDPVDGDSMGMGNDVLDKCVSKSEYFISKYANTDDYAPLAAIHAITATQKTLESGFNLSYSNLNIATSTSQPNVDIQSKLVNQKLTDAGYVATFVIPGAVNDMTIQQKVSKLGSGGGNRYAAQACSALENPERVKYAYDVCKLLKTMDDDTTFADKYVNPNVADKTAAIKKLKLSCNALFSDYNTSSAFDSYTPDDVEPEDILIKFDNIDGTEVDDLVADPYDRANNIPPEGADAPFVVLPRSVKLGITLALLPFLLFALYIVITNLYVVLKFINKYVLRNINRYVFSNIKYVLCIVLQSMNILKIDTPAHKIVWNYQFDLADAKDTGWWLNRVSERLTKERDDLKFEYKLP